MEQRLIRLEILIRDFHWRSSIFIAEEFISTPKGPSIHPQQRCIGSASLHLQHWVGKRILTSSLSSALPMCPFFSRFLYMETNVGGILDSFSNT
jgi:hypothetical protein